MPKPSTYKVKVVAAIQFNDEPVTISYEYSKGAKEADPLFRADLGDRSIGELIEGAVKIFRPTFSLDLPFPWDKLFGAELKGVKFTYRPKTKFFGVEVNGFDIDLGLVQITGLAIEARSKNVVNVSFDGTFFGRSGPVKFNAAGAEGPPLPPQKPPVFDLKFLGLGQHVSFRNSSGFEHVKDAIGVLRDSFKTPVEGSVVPALHNLKYDEKSNWLFGIDAEILPPLLAFQVIFNDPSLYGLYIKLGGEKAKALDGLEFEILYKKITEDVGVYQAEIKLPFYLRNLEFGALSITLPKIGVDIYTNGNFKIDLGFPYNMNFADSLIIQFIPFTGAGGLYFASLNGATSTKVPKTTTGIFEAVIEFGIGLNLGIGKRIDKGVFKAELSLVYFGILEGVFANFKPLPIGNQVAKGGSEELYYSLQGTFGIIGRVWGYVDFVIISASFEVVIFASVTVSLIAAEPMHLQFVAGVSISLKVKIGFGIFSFSIRLSFSKTVRAAFTIGSSDPAPWKALTTQSNFNPGAIPIFSQEIMGEEILFNWKANMEPTGTPQPLEIYFLPQFSVRRKNGKQEAMGVAMLFLRNQINTEQNEDLTQAVDLTQTFAFEQLCIRFLLWVLNASEPLGGRDTDYEEILEQSITLTDLYNIYYTLKSNKDPFTYNDIKGFLSANFSVNLLHRDTLSEELQGEDVSITVFPMIPELTVSSALNDVAEHVADLSVFNKVDEEYLDQVTNERKKYAQSGRSSNSGNADNRPLCELVFLDYFTTLAKDLTQGAIDSLELHRYAIPVSITGQTTTLKGVARHLSIEPFEVVKLNKELPGLLKTGATVLIPDRSYQIVTGDSLSSIRSKANHNFNAREFDVFLELNKNYKILNADVTINVGNTSYQTASGDTLSDVSKGLNISLSELAISVADDVQLLKTFVSLDIPGHEHEVTVEDTFASVAKKHRVSIEGLIESNLDNEGLLQEGTIIVVENVPVITIESLIQYLLTNGEFEQSSGLVSRVFLNGLRLPVKGLTDSINTDSKDDALYTLTGQAFPIPALKILTKEETERGKKADKYGVGLSKNPNANWFQLAGSDHDLMHYLDEPEIVKVNAFNKVVFAPPFKQGRTKLFKYQPKRFTLTNNIILRAEDRETEQSILQFSTPLVSYLAKNKKGSSTIRLFKTDIDSLPKNFKKDDHIPTGEYSFGLLLSVYIRKLPPGHEGKISKNTFEIFGTDSGGLLTLTELLKDLDANPIEDIRVLFRPQETDEKGYQSHDPEKVLSILINTNLSTETNPEDLLFTQSDDPQNIADTEPGDFVKRLWKASVVRTGGYYLYYTKHGGDEGLPEEVFDANGAAEIALFIRFKSKDECKSYVNSVVLSSAINQAEEVIDAVPFVKIDSNWLPLEEKAIIVDQGQEGFEVQRDAPQKVNDSFDEAYEIEQLYNLLSFEVIGDQVDENEKPSDTITGLGRSESLSPSKDDFDDNAHAENNRITESDDDPENQMWIYRKVIPLKDIVTLSDKGKQGLPPINSPYIALGKKLLFEVEWRDSHGFELDAIPGENADNRIEFDILYRDQILGLNQWPGLDLFYDFSDKKKLLVTLGFNAGIRYKIDVNQSGPELDAEIAKVKEKAYSDLKKYTTAYYQLSEETLNITLNVSMMPDHIFDLSQYRSKIVSLLTGICADIELALKDLEGFQRRNVATRVVDINETVKDDHPDDIYPLDVVIDFERDSNLVDPEMQDLHAVLRVTSIIQPKNEILDDAQLEDKNRTQLYALRRFAANFENTFEREGLKIALSYSGGHLSEKGELQRDSEIWVARLKQQGLKGINHNIDYDNPIYYAPQPLSNQLLLLDQVSIKPYKKDEGLVAKEEQKSFIDVDPEQWARIFLEDFEEYLHPIFTIPLTMLDGVLKTSYLSRLLDAKRKLATGISYQTIPILQQNPTSDAISMAREKLRQQLLIDLLDGYLIDTVVQYPVEVSSQFDETNKETSKFKPPNLYGKTVPAKVDGDQTSKSNNYSISTGKIPLHNTRSYLTFTFNTAQDKFHSNVPLDLRYKISHLEYDIIDVKKLLPREDESMKDFDLSKWLSFVIPISETKQVSTTHIPVPIRSYPTSPNLESQLIVTKDIEIDSGDGIETIKSYDYAFEYRAEFTSQDTLNFEVVFNSKKENYEDLAEQYKPDGLDIQLAQYMHVRNEMHSNLSELLRDDVKDLSIANNVCESFVRLFESVSNEWYLRYHPDNTKQQAKGNLKELIARFNIVEEALNAALPNDDQDNHYMLYIDDWEVNGKGIQTPSIEMEGYHTEVIGDEANDTNRPTNRKAHKFYKLTHNKKVYLKFSEGIGLEKRKVIFRDLDILSIQNAWAGTRVIRNVDLLGGIQNKELRTRDEFVYKTPLVRYSDPVTPRIHNATPIEYLNFVDEGRVASMKTQLDRLVAYLFTGTPVENSDAIYLKIKVSFSYIPVGQPKSYKQEITLPILLTVPMLLTREVSNEVSGSLGDLAGTIEGWLRDKEPVITFNQAKLYFDVTCFSLLADGDLPILQLKNLFIREVDIEWR